MLSTQYHQSHWGQHQTRSGKEPAKARPSMLHAPDTPLTTSREMKPQAGSITQRLLETKSRKDGSLQGGSEWKDEEVVKVEVHWRMLARLAHVFPRNCNHWKDTTSKISCRELIVGVKRTNVR
eukprot:1522348-Amphidinium_carterae.1